MADHCQVAARLSTKHHVGESERERGEEINMKQKGVNSAAAAAAHTHGIRSVGGAQCEGLTAQWPVTAAVMFHLMRPLCGLLFKCIDRRILSMGDRFPYS